MRLIDADELKDFFFSETSEMKETISDLMSKYDLDYAHDVDEEDVMDFVSELLEKVRNVIDNMPTAYDIDKVVKRLKKHAKYALQIDKSIDDYQTINECIEIIKQQIKEQK